MSSQTGKTVRVNYWHKKAHPAARRGASAFGVARRPSVRMESTTVKERGTGTRRLTVHQFSHAIPRWDIDYDYQTGEYISGFVLSFHGLEATTNLSGTVYDYFNGCSGWRMTGVLPDTCRVACRVDGPVKVSLSLIGEHMFLGSGTAANMEANEYRASGNVACWADTRVRFGCTPAAAELLNWTEWEFNINNHITTEKVGREEYAQVLEGEVDYAGTIRRTIRCKTGLPTKIPHVSGGITTDICFIISGADGNRWRYCFDDCILNVSRSENDDLGLIFETIGWESRHCSGWRG